MMDLVARKGYVRFIGCVYEECMGNSWIRSVVEPVWMYGIEWRRRMEGSEVRLGLEDFRPPCLSKHRHGDLIQAGVNV